eukprot:3438101-Pyramimonas_sp.AAC.1
MEGGVEIHAEEIAGRKRAASAAVDDNKSAKRTAVSSRGKYRPARSDPSFVVFPTRPNGPGPVMPGTLSSHTKRGW